MTLAEMEAKRNQVNAMRESILTLVSPANREDASKKIEELSNAIAMTATDIAIKATTDQFVIKIKEAAQAGQKQAEEQTNASK